MAGAAEPARGGARVEATDGHGGKSRLLFFHLNEGVLASEGGCGRGQGGGVLQRRVNRATAPAVEGTSRPARGEGEAAGARSPW